MTEALRAAGEDFRLLLLSDHMTYMANGAHGADPVPFVLYDSRVSGAPACRIPRPTAARARTWTTARS